MILKRPLILLILLVSGILGINALHTHFRESAAPAAGVNPVSHFSAAQPGQDKVLSLHAAAGLNDQIDDDGIDDETIVKLIMAGALALLSFLLLPRIKARSVSFHPPVRLFPYASRIIFLGTFRI